MRYYDYSIFLTVTCNIKILNYKYTMIQPEKAINTDPLLQEYNDDVMRWAVTTFKAKGVSLERLRRWEQKYPIILPWNKEYNSERIGYNRIYQVYPLLIVMAKKKKHIIWALKKARELGLSFSLKCGGHCHSGSCLSDGFIINVSQRNKIKIHNQHKYVNVGCGVLLGQLDVELFNHSPEILPHGTCASVSAVGLVMGGGIGSLTRKFGLTSDHLLSATVILANGQVITASKDINEDVFWLLRGAGANAIGIVTDMKLKIHKAPRIVLFELKYDWSQLKDLLKMWDSFGPYADNNLTSKILFFPISNKEVEYHVILKGNYEGSKTCLEKLLENYILMARKAKVWKAELLEVANFYNDGTKDPLWYFFYESMFTNKIMSDETIKVLTDFAETASPLSSVVMNALAGRMADPKPTDTAFFWRDSKLWIHIMSETRDAREYPLMKREVKKVYNDLLNSGLRDPVTNQGHLYINFKDLELTKEQYMLAYWGDNHKRITEIKQKYDPDNVFTSVQGL